MGVISGAVTQANSQSSSGLTAKDITDAPGTTKNINMGTNCRMGGTVNVTGSTTVTTSAPGVSPETISNNPVRIIEVFDHVFRKLKFKLN